MAYIKRFSHIDLDNMRFSQKINVFHGRQTPENGLLVGSGAVIDALKLSLLQKPMHKTTIITNIILRLFIGPF